jgi:hypothetical protein
MQQAGAGPSGGEEVSAAEVLEPLNDELIRRCLAIGPWEHNGKPLWHRLLDWAVEPGAHEHSSPLRAIHCPS